MLKFSKTQSWSNEHKVPGWRKVCETPAGNYAIEYLNTPKREFKFLLLFGVLKIGTYAVERSALGAAETHFESLVKQCNEMITS